MEHLLFWMIPVSSLLALLLAWYFYRQMMRESEGTPAMQKIASHVRQGAMSYLKQQYKIVGLVFLALVVLFSVMAYGFNLQNSWVPIAFLTGGFFSGLSGFLGMKTATYASARTANAARNSLNKGLRVAFRSGAVMGLVVVGLGLFDIQFSGGEIIKKEQRFRPLNQNIVDAHGHKIDTYSIVPVEQRGKLEFCPHTVGGRNKYRRFHALKLGPEQPSESPDVGYDTRDAGGSNQRFYAGNQLIAGIDIDPCISICLRTGRAHEA